MLRRERERANQPPTSQPKPHTHTHTHMGYCHAPLLEEVVVDIQLILPCEANKEKQRSHAENKGRWKQKENDGKVRKKGGEPVSKCVCVGDKGNGEASAHQRTRDIHNVQVQEGACHLMERDVHVDAHFLISGCIHKQLWFHVR